MQQALDHLLEGNSEITTVVIAHRLRTVRNADKIVVLSDGEVAEQGSHEELCQLRGVYHRMLEQAGSEFITNDGP